MMKNRLFACSMALASALLFTANLVGSDQPIPSTVIDIIAGYAAEGSAIVIPAPEVGDLDLNYHEVAFQNDDRLTITALYSNGYNTTVYATTYTKQKSPLRYIKGQTTNTHNLPSWLNQMLFIDDLRKSNPQNILWFCDNDKEPQLKAEEIKKLITLPAKDILNVSASDLYSHEQAPKIAVSTLESSTIYSFDPSPERVNAINNALNGKFLYADRARRSNTATPKALNAQFIQEDRARKNNKTTRKALLATIALTGAAAAYTGCQ